MISKRQIYGGIVFSISMYLIVTISQDVWRLWNSRASITDAEEKVKVLYKEHAALSSKLEQVDSREFIEREARETLNLVQPGETVVLLPPEIPVVVKYGE